MKKLLAAAWICAGLALIVALTPPAMYWVDYLQRGHRDEGAALVTGLLAALTCLFVVPLLLIAAVILAGVWSLRSLSDQDLEPEQRRRFITGWLVVSAAIVALTSVPVWFTQDTFGWWPALAPFAVLAAVLITVLVLVLRKAARAARVDGIVGSPVISTSSMSGENELE